jgi:hypothetical protein
MKQIQPWDAASRLGGQEIALILWNTKVHNHAHMGQMKPVSNVIPYSFKIDCNIIIPSTHGSVKLPFSFRIFD